VVTRETAETEGDRLGEVEGEIEGDREGVGMGERLGEGPAERETEEGEGDREGEVLGVTEGLVGVTTGVFVGVGCTSFNLLCKSFRFCCGFLSLYSCCCGACVFGNARGDFDG